MLHPIRGGQRCAAEFAGGCGGGLTGCVGTDGTNAGYQERSGGGGCYYPFGIPGGIGVGADSFGNAGAGGGLYGGCSSDGGGGSGYISSLSSSGSFPGGATTATGR